MSRCLVKEAAFRPRALDLLTHPFVQKAFQLNAKDVFAETLADFRYKKARQANAQEGGEEESRDTASSHAGSKSEHTDFM